MKWTDNLNEDEKKTVTYIREQAIRIGGLYNVVMSDDVIRYIYYFVEKHLTDSYQTYDTIELVAKVIVDIVYKK